MNNLDRFNTNFKQIVQRKKIQRSIASSCPTSSRSLSSVKNLKSCADFQAWQWFEDHKPHLALAFLCHQPKLCPLCAKIHSVIRAYNVQELVSKVCSRNGYLYNFTLTIKDRDNLSSALSDLDVIRNRLSYSIRNIQFGKYLNYTELSKIKGYFLKLEIKRGSGSGLWHPHYHGMLYSEQMIDYEKFRKELNSLDGQNHSNNITLMNRCNDEKFMLGVLESVKYMCKFSTDKQFMDDIWHIYYSTFRKRMFFKYGVFRDLYEDKEIDISPDKQVLFYHLVRFLDGDNIPDSKIMSVEQFESEYLVPASNRCNLSGVQLASIRSEKRFHLNLEAPEIKKDEQLYLFTA